MDVKALFLSYAYPPLRFPRAIQVGHLVRHSGLERLEIVCADDPEAANDESLRSVAGERPVLRLGWSPRARLLRRVRAHTLEDRFLVPDLYRPWAADAARAIVAGSDLGPGDVLVSFGQPMSDHLAAGRVARRTGARWIAHLSDPWVDNALIPRGRLARRITARQERAALAAADAIVFTSSRTAELVMRKYPDSWRARTHVVPHCFDSRLYPASAGAADGPLVVRYVGNFYRGRTPEPLFRALAELHRSRPSALAGVRVELVGSSELGPATATAETELPDGLVATRGPASYLDALGLMRSADLLLVVDAPSHESVFLPSKLVEYLGAARPIVGLTPPGEAASLIGEAGGWCAAPDRPAEAAAALDAGLEAAREHRGRDWGDPAIRSRFEATAIAAELDGLVAAVGGGGPPGRARTRRYRPAR